MSVKEQYSHPNQEKNNSCKLTHAERPRHVRNVVQEYVGKWGIGLHVWNAVVNDHHDDGSDPSDGKKVHHAHCCFPHFWFELQKF